MNEDDDIKRTSSLKNNSPKHPAGYENNPLAIIQLNDQFRVTQLNKIAADFFSDGIKDSLSWFEQFPALIGGPIHEAIINSLSSGQETGLITEWPANGKKISFTVSAMQNGLILMIRELPDDTAGDQLNRQLHFLNQVALTLPDMVGVFDLKTKRLVYTNQHQHLSHGYDDKKLKEMDPWERPRTFIHPDDLENYEKYFQSFQTMEANGVEMLEFRARNDYGEWQWYKSRGKIFHFDKQGNPSHCLNIVQNITPRKKVEESIRKNLAILQQAEELAQLGSWEYNTVTGEFTCSDCMYNLFALPPGSDVTPKVFSDFAYEDDAGIASRIIYHLEVTNEPFEETLRINVDGRIRTLRIKSLVEESGIPMMKKLLGINMDISDLIRAENELKHLNISLNERNWDLEEKNEELAAFAFIASHDLKEPLRKINTFSSWLLEKEMIHLSEQGKAYLQRMQNSVGRMELLIEDILSLLRLQEIAQELMPVDLNKVLDKCIEELESQVTEAGAKIIKERLPVIMGLHSSLFYLFNNIIGNAIKFRHKDRLIVIRISSKKVSGSETGFPQANPNITYLQVTFTDNGIGFEDKYNKLIFQMFQRLNGKAEYAGTGIGLTICKKIMENHNGLIAASSEPGIGSAFRCYFPL